MNEAERALARQQEIINLVESEGREMTDAERSEFNALQRTIDEATQDTTPEADNNNAQRDNQGGSPAPQPTPETQNTNGNREQQTAANYGAAAAEISAMCRQFGIEPDDYLNRGLSVEQASAEILRRQMQIGSPIPANSGVIESETDKIRSAMTDAIILKGNGTVESQGRNKYRDMTLREMAIECLERENPRGDYRHMDTDSLWDKVRSAFFNPTALFPSIADDAIQKSYVEGLAKANVSFDRFVKKGSLSNFKKTKNHEYIMSLTGILEEVPENGELKSYVPSDALAPERQLKTFGRQFTMTREAFYNDDIGLLTSMPRRYAMMTLRTQNNAVYKLLLGDVKLPDGKAMCDESHNNIIKTGTGVTRDAFRNMLFKLATQKDIAGNELALVPDVVIVPTGMGDDVQTLLASPVIQTTDNTQAINPYYNRNFEVVEDVFMYGMLDPKKAMPWFVGVKGEFIQIDYLNGNENATIRRSEVPGRLGMVWDVFFDFAVSPIHPEAVVKNPGIVQKFGE